MPLIGRMAVAAHAQRGGVATPQTVERVERGEAVFAAERLDLRVDAEERVGVVEAAREVGQHGDQQQSTVRPAFAGPVLEPKTEYNRTTSTRN